MGSIRTRWLVITGLITYFVLLIATIISFIFLRPQKRWWWIVMLLVGILPPFIWMALDV